MSFPCPDTPKAVSKDGSTSSEMMEIRCKGTKNVVNTHTNDAKNVIFCNLYAFC